jgi:hypothetical protein
MSGRDDDPCPERCGRPRAKHWRRRLCGPLTGTAAGPMSPEERERYLAGTRRAA